MERVSPKSRILAALIDGGIVFVASMIVVACVVPSAEKIAEKVMSQSDNFEQMFELGAREAAFWQRVSNLLCAIVVLGYGSTEIIKGASVGKMIMGIRIAKADGSNADVVTLAKRFAVKNAASLLCVLAFLTTLNFVIYLGWLANLGVLVAWAMCFRPSRLAMYDEYLGTGVYRTSPAPVASAAQPAVA